MKPWKDCPDCEGTGECIEVTGEFTGGEPTRLVISGNHACQKCDAYNAGLLAALAIVDKMQDFAVTEGAASMAMHAREIGAAIRAAMEAK